MRLEKIFTCNSDSKDMKTLVLFQDLNDELISLIKSKIKEPLCIVGFREVDWNRDFSPWPYEKFSGEGKRTIETVLKSIEGDFLVCGYSLGGLMALVTLTMSDRVKGCASVSGSLWYPGLVDYLKSHKVHGRKIYLSLGDLEANTRHPLMSTVAIKTEEVKSLLEKENELVFSWNKGNHFFEADNRLLKAIYYLLNI